MALNEKPIGTYADVTGVVDTTAAAEIVALIAVLDGLIPDPADQSDVPDSPDFNQIDPAMAVLLRSELDALAAAIAAAPTS